MLSPVNTSDFALSRVNTNGIALSLLVNRNDVTSLGNIK